MQRLRASRVRKCQVMVIGAAVVRRTAGAGKKAVWRSGHGSDPLSPMGAFLMLASLVNVLTAAPAWAARRPRDARREASIVEELRSRSPEAVGDFETATAALDENDFATAAAGYRRVLERASEFNIALRRLAACLVQQGETAEGIAWPSTRRGSRNPRRTFPPLRSVWCCIGPETPVRNVMRRAMGLASRAAAIADRSRLPRSRSHDRLASRRSGGR